MPRQAPVLGTILFLLFGPLIWAVHLFTVYAGHASLCEAGDRLPLLDADALPWLLGGATAAALLILALGSVRPAIVRRLLRATSPAHDEMAFTTSVMRMLAALSALGVVFAGVAILLVPLCAQLR